jgi:Predicted transcriptional regulators
MFAERLKKLRTDKGLSQEDLAKIVGVKQQTIGGWENGRTEPDHQITCKLADFFGVTTDELLGRENKLLVPKNGIITMNDIRKANITNNEIEIIKVTRKEGLTAEDIQHLAEVVKRHKPKSADHEDKKSHDSKTLP